MPIHTPIAPEPPDIGVWGPGQPPLADPFKGDFEHMVGGKRVGETRRRGTAIFWIWHPGHLRRAPVQAAQSHNTPGGDSAPHVCHEWEQEPV